MIKRPLSPHLHIYRLPPTALFSITHRLTGVIVVVGFLCLTLFLTALAGGTETFALAQSGLRSIGGRLFLGVWMFSLFLHLCHGIRHLLWDTGHGFARETLNRHAWMELAASVMLTGLSFLLT